MRNSSKSGAFLVEMIIVIAFFAVASAICIRLFAHAHTISAKSRDLNMATVAFQTAAESFKAASGDSEQLLKLLPEQAIGDTESGVFLVLYDSDWNICDSGKEAYKVSILVNEENPLRVAGIDVQKCTGPTGGDQYESLFSGQVYSYA